MGQSLGKVIRWALVLGAAIVIVFTGLEMRAEKFWGYTPLYFFISCWVLIVALLLPVYSKHPQKVKLLALSSLAGFILFLGFPTKPVTPFMFVGMIPLLYIEDKIFKWRPEISRWEIFKYTFNAFLIWNILSTFWVANTAFVPSIFAFTLNAAFMTIPWMGYHWVRKRLGDRYKYMALVCFWLCFEWIHLQWEISWPWLTLGNAFAQYPFVVQWYEYTGHLGGSLWILVMNILLYIFIVKLRAKVELKVEDLMYPVFTLFGPLMLSAMIYVTYQEKGELRNISIVQPNYEPHYEKFTVSDAEQLRTFVRLSELCLTDSTDYLLYPETIFGAFDVDKLNEEEPIKVFRSMLERFPRTNLVTGLVTYEVFGDNEERSDAARKVTWGGKETWLELQNSAVQFPAGSDTDYDVHVKSKLVPGAEIFPYNKLLFFLTPIIKMSGGSVDGHGRQKERTVFSNQYEENIAPVICYESVYGEYVGQYMRKGANAIFIMTNDGWWDRTPGHVQHLKFAQIRAIEHRRAVARSANTGISAFIDQRGNILERTKYGKEATLQGSIRFNKELTFYSRWGDIIARMGILGSLLLLVSGTMKRFRKE
ncbi:apolipoprotein N-acyltransferase [Portibacter lacus]|uniref:Apolipoprotein N-acyltransferase n=1 Tax=Portibacter lacus TaxID=1099794 RepID=A0AA37ST89_9BACT|nr:apolipoprotein N-acyltransferase [Portibacter lacus]GLR19219.1 apolipoprotein N-acyltransferase [Portibacter lacus]